MTHTQKYNAIVLGVSAGGMNLINKLVPSLPEDFTVPVLVVQHVPDFSDGDWPDLLNERSKVKVKEADEKERIRPATVYFAPANYHMLLEPDLTLTFTVDEPVNYARPSIDVLFETAAESCKDKVIGIVCTGGNADGANGLLRIKERGGLTIVQEPETAEVKSMPLAAIQTADPDYLLSPNEMLDFLINIYSKKAHYEFEN